MAQAMTLARIAKPVRLGPPPTTAGIRSVPTARATSAAATNNENGTGNEEWISPLPLIAMKRVASRRARSANAAHASAVVRRSPTPGALRTANETRSPPNEARSGIRSTPAMSRRSIHHRLTSMVRPRSSPTSPTIVKQPRNSASPRSAVAPVHTSRFLTTARRLGRIPCDPRSQCCIRRRECHNRDDDRISPAHGAVSGRSVAGRSGRLREPCRREAFDLLSSADREGSLSGADLESFSQAAFFAGQASLGLELKERAFKAQLTGEDQVRAAYLALDIAHDYGMTGRISIASAWLRRGEKLLEDQPESYAHAYLALDRSEAARGAGNVDEALAQAEKAVTLATNAHHPDMQAAALTNFGSLRIATGATSDGIAMMEEASVAAVNGELSPIATGIACCRMIAACRDLTDYRRASEWTEATEKWCERQSVAGFPGVCRIHRAEVVAIGGAWDRAELELRRAADELAGYNATIPLADGLYAQETSAA